MPLCRDGQSFSVCVAKSAKINDKNFPCANQQFVFSHENVGEEQKKGVFTPSDVMFSPRNVDEEQKKVFTSSDVLRRKKIKGLNVGQ